MECKKFIQFACLLVFMLIAKVGYASDYYVDCNAGTGGDGSLTTPWDAVADVNATSFPAGDNIYFKKGCIFRDQLIFVDTSGTESSLITLSSYGSGELPLVTGFRIIESAWSQYGATNIYQTSNTAWMKMVLQDGTILTYVTWNTNIATTASAMSAGTWTVDTTGDLLYVWTTDSVNPTGKTIEYTFKGKAITFSNCDYFNLSYLKFSGGQDAGISFGSQTNDTTWSNHIIFDHVIVTQTGGRAFNINGNYNTVKNCETSYWNTHANSVDNAGIVFHGSYNVAENNYVHDSIWGSGFEVSIQTPYATEYNIVRNNIGKNLTQQLIELYGSYNNEVYANYGENILKDGIKLTYGAYNNSVHHNIINGYGYSGIRITKIGVATYVLNNNIYNNTIIDSTTSTMAGLSVYEANNTGNVFKNNIVYVLSNPALYVREANNTFDNNLYYRASGTLIDWNGTTYTLAQFSTYQSETGKDTHSIASNPRFVNPAGDNYHLCKKSPCIDAGTDVGLTEDYEGNPIPLCGIPDMGAYESTCNVCD